MKLRKNVRSNLTEKRNYKKSLITRKKPFKSLTSGINRKYGRDNSGKITVRHKHKGHKRSYRIIGTNRQRSILDMNAEVVSVEYDPNRSSMISLIKYDNGKHEYMHHIKGIKVGDTVIASKNKVEDKIGNRTTLKHISIGSEVCCIESVPGRGWNLCLSAGTYASLIDVLSDHAILTVSSGEMKKFHLDCMATIGRISNEKHKNFVMYKAGNSFHKGIRPTVRGTAMNPVSHPHGGGEGRKGTKRHPVSYTGKITKGGRTANLKRSSKNRIIRKRKN